MANYLFLNKGVAKRNDNIVDNVSGGVKVYLRERYGSNEVYTVSQTDMGKTVGNTQGSIKLDKFSANQIKYLFGVELPEDSFLNIQVSVWGKKAEALTKFNLNKGDGYMFFASDVKLDKFSRRDGTEGYAMRVNAYDFDPIRSGAGENTGANAGANAGANGNAGAQAKPAQVPNVPTYSQANDFAAIDDSDDLPF